MSNEIPDGPLQNIFNSEPIHDIAKFIGNYHFMNNNRIKGIIKTTNVLFFFKKKIVIIIMNSFAIVLWEIASQKSPFEEKALDDLKSLVLAGARPQPVSIRGTPVAYQKMMEKAWDLDPKQRPTIEEMLKTLN